MYFAYMLGSPLVLRFFVINFAQFTLDVFRLITLSAIYIIKIFISLQNLRAERAIAILSFLAQAIIDNDASL